MMTQRQARSIFGVHQWPSPLFHLVCNKSNPNYNIPQRYLGQFLSSIGISNRLCQLILEVKHITKLAINVIDRVVKTNIYSLLICFLCFFISRFFLPIVAIRQIDNDVSVGGFQLNVHLKILDEWGIPILVIIGLSQISVVNLIGIV